MGSVDLKNLGCEKIMVEYFSNHQGDFYSLPVQVFGLPHVGCPFDCLKVRWLLFNYAKNRGAAFLGVRLPELKWQSITRFDCIHCKAVAFTEFKRYFYTFLFQPLIGKVL